jgi:hypothetical protein
MKINFFFVIVVVMKIKLSYLVENYPNLDLHARIFFLKKKSSQT